MTRSRPKCNCDGVEKLLDKRRWSGNEIVMDAGAGSGNLTRILADKVPNGQIYAVDSDPSMVEQAKINLSDCSNVQVIHSSMDDVKLQTKVDVIFSNAALHWILDQQKILSYFWQLLKPNGELLIECSRPWKSRENIVFNFQDNTERSIQGKFCWLETAMVFPKARIYQKFATGYRI